MSQSTHDAMSHSRQGLLSLAHLLLVAGLKLNATIVPVLLRWVRGRRQNWIRRSSGDVSYDLLNQPGKRFLCFGECCNHTYEVGAEGTSHHIDIEDRMSFDDKETDDSSEDGQEVIPSPKTSSNGPVRTKRPSTSLRSKSSKHESSKEIKHTTVEGKSTEDGFMFDFVPAMAVPFVERSLGDHSHPDDVQDMSVQERYFRLLVAQEENHRSNKSIPWVYHTVLYAFVTVVSLIVYATVIILISVKDIPMSTQECIFFSFSLVTTGMVSESDKLLKTYKKRSEVQQNIGEDVKPVSYPVPTPVQGH